MGTEMLSVMIPLRGLITELRSACPVGVWPHRSTPGAINRAATTACLLCLQLFHTPGGSKVLMREMCSNALFSFLAMKHTRGLECERHPV